STGPGPPEHEEMVGRPRILRLQADGRHADLEPAGGRRVDGHHGHRAHGVAVLRRADTCRYRWEADLLTVRGLGAGGWTLGGGGWRSSVTRPVRAASRPRAG